MSKITKLDHFRFCKIFKKIRSSFAITSDREQAIKILTNTKEMFPSDSMIANNRNSIKNVPVAITAKPEMT